MPPSKKPKIAVPRAVVYLGASAPVHATHTRLIRSLLDEGHDHVFVFILAWSPDRAGVSAEAGTTQLATWLLGFPAVERAKVHVEMVNGEGEGAAKMRATLGPDAVLEVEVCFSQKYSEQVERIQKNWLPLYTKEFPSAKPRFLTDETDPGAATAYGTAAFVQAVKDGAATETSIYKPEQETVQGWAAYVDGLLHGANGDPFYSPSELGALQVQFFADTAVLHALDNPLAWRTAKIPGGAKAYFQDAKAFGPFWHKMALPSDTALFKQFCLRAQGVTRASALAAMPPPCAMPWLRPVGAVKPYVVLAAEAMHPTAEGLVAIDPTLFSYYVPSQIAIRSGHPAAAARGLLRTCIHDTMSLHNTCTTATTTAHHGHVT
jgi:hypothetical protein